MKVCIQGFLGKNHSWSFVNQNIARGLINLGHDVHLQSTNGYEFFPEDLKNNIISNFDKVYDVQISYTAMKNFQYYLSKGNKNRFSIWCWEWPILPTGFSRHHVFVDKILAPSQFAKNIFINNNIPENKIIVIPHGVDIEKYNTKEKYKLKTQKTKKIFVNIGQPHKRKNIKGMLEAFGLAFTNKDDVCLVAKIHKKNKIEYGFEININEVFNEFKIKYKNHAEIELITEYIPDIASLYNACDIVYTLSHCEGFYMPGIEALFCNKINICPRYGGQLDFLNDDNALLIDGKITRAPIDEQYWTPNKLNSHFEADLQDAADKLKQAINNYDELKEKFFKEKDFEKYSWKTQVNKIMELVK